MEKLLKFCFKGSRNYLHSTDVFNTMLSLFGKDIGNIDFSFYRITDKNILLTDIKPSSNESLVFTFSFQRNKEKFTYYGLETKTPIDCRYPYDEDAIVANALLDHTQKCAILNSSTKYSFIEHLVALTKVMHLNFLPPNKGKWFFARLQLLEVPENFLPLKVCLKQKLGLKLTRSSVFVDDKLLGSIYFSLVGEK